MIIGRRSPAALVLGGCLLFLGGLRPAGGLDFRLHSATVEEDGFTREQLFFSNDATTSVQIRFPAGWSHADTAVSLLLTPPGAGGNMIRIEKSGFGPDVLFRDRGLATYRARVLAGVPPGATATHFTAETPNPLPIFGWQTYEFTVGYELFGQSFKRSVLYVNLNARDQLEVTSSAQQSDFEGIHAASLDVMRSWQIVPAAP